MGIFEFNFRRFEFSKKGPGLVYQFPDVFVFQVEVHKLANTFTDHAPAFHATDHAHESLWLVHESAKQLIATGGLCGQPIIGVEV